MDWMGEINLMCTYVRRKELLEVGVGKRIYWVVNFIAVAFILLRASFIFFIRKKVNFKKWVSIFKTFQNGFTMSY